MDYAAIVERVKEISRPILTELELELVDITFRYESAGLVLRLLVDREGGVTVDDCAALNERLSAALDEADVIEKRYMLDVSSPGLDRPLTTKRDFERAIDELVRFTTSVPIADSATNTGYIRDVGEDRVIIETKRGLRLEIPMDKIERAVREIEF